jgi:4-amino-4-deoxy-L-arabinose transferase-like glycosyltransferase
MTRHPARDLLLLTALCWAVYCTGLITHGLTNWQEAQRALVAREMQSRHEWIVPTVHGRPYLAKPPMIYWAQLALSKIAGGRTGEFELRLSVALAGWIGVLATYIVGRRLENRDLEAGAKTAANSGEAAWWASLFLATGILYVRSSRVGELDILLVPFTVIAIGAVQAAWRSHLDRKRTNYPAVLLAILCATGAMLTKGPPGLLAIALAAYGGVALWHGQEAREPARTHPPSGTLPRLAAACGAFLLPAAALALNWPPRLGFEQLLGLALYGTIGAAAGWVIGTCLRPPAAGAIIRTYARTHPVAVLGIPFLALWAWGQLVAARIGPDALNLAVRTETADNLRALVLASPTRNLSAAAFGAGLGSFAALGAGVWLVRRRIRLTPELAILVAWVAGGLIAFSFLGKGVGRYLTPLWPGLALLGGLWWARTWPTLPLARWMRGITLLAVALLALWQGWWYAIGRELYHAERSPRAIIGELFSRPDFDISRFATLDFDTPAIDYYAGRSIPFLSARSDSDAARLLQSHDYTLLVREEALSSDDLRPLLAAGLRVERIQLESEFRIDNLRSPVVAVRINPPSAGASPPAPSAASDPPE